MYLAWAIAAAAVDWFTLGFAFTKRAAVPDTKGALKDVPEAEA